MKRVLYLTNLEAPYRVRFFNLLAEQCDLTVVCERRRCVHRDDRWQEAQHRHYRRIFLRGIPLRRESGFSLGILREVSRNYDRIIVGCCNSPAQMAAMLWMRLRRIPYCLNLDGEVFFRGNRLKARLKRFFLRGASAYLVAGERAAASLREIAGNAPVIPYYFGSLSREELTRHRRETCDRDSSVLIVGQYHPTKGLDVALEAAAMDSDATYRFVGMGRLTDRFRREHSIPANVQLIPFLSKPELDQAYRQCGMLVLPSRQECWGLVIPEAASFGTPVVSTWGSGAAVEFLADQYPQYLAVPGDAKALHRTIVTLRQNTDSHYSDYLREKAGDYSLEAGVAAHMDWITREEI